MEIQRSQFEPKMPISQVHFADYEVLQQAYAT